MFVSLFTIPLFTRVAFPREIFTTTRLRVRVVRVKFSFFIRSSKNLETLDVEHDKSRPPFFATELINVVKVGVKRSLKNTIRILVSSHGMLIS